MFDFKIKTLDGGTHEFSVDDEITVAQFKEQIRDKMNIEVERQRLLYQGRVLQDDRQLSSYNVAGNVMHLVTRLPPSQNRPTASDISVSDRDDSDVNREQIRNIISDALSNIELNQMGNISVNNEGNRMDITVNIPSHNRLSLARLRYNYQQRLLAQARTVLEYMRDSTVPAPQPDYERLYQNNPYDLRSNEERLVEVTSSPLPIEHLADMIDDVRRLWRESEPNFDTWQRALRRYVSPENSESNTLSATECQHLHDNGSRLLHLFSHMFHIMSDYLAEFTQHTCTNATQNDTPVQPETRETGISVNLESEENGDNFPLIGGCGESTAVTNSSTSQTETNNQTNTGQTNDRNRFLYVFSEIPAQVVQVRLDVDSDMPDFIRELSGSLQSQPNRPIRPRASSVGRATPASSNSIVPGNNTEGGRVSPMVLQYNAQTSGTTETSTQETATNASPRSNIDGRTVVTPNVIAGTTRMRRLPLRSELFRVPRQIHRHVYATSGTPATGGTSSGTSSGASNTSSSTSAPASHLTSGASVDPYVRCHSRHFQSPAMRTNNTVISAAYSNFRTLGVNPNRENRNRNTATSTATSTATTNENPVGSTNNASPISVSANTGRNQIENSIYNPLQQFMGSIVNSILSAVGGTSTTTSSSQSGNSTTTQSSSSMSTSRNESMPMVESIISAFANEISSNEPLSNFIHELFNQAAQNSDNGYALRYEERLLPQILDRLITRLTMNNQLDVQRLHIRINGLRSPLQQLLHEHQMGYCSNSREILIQHLIDDMDVLNKPLYLVFEELRNGNTNDNMDNPILITPILLSEHLVHLNRTIDVASSMRRVYATNMRILVDLILRSPTDIGFGELLMTSLNNFHEEFMVLVEILCGEDITLRTELFNTFLNRITCSTENNSEVNLGRSRVMQNFVYYERSSRYTEIRESVLNNYVCYLDKEDKATEKEVDKEIKENGNVESREESLDEVVDSLSGGMLKRERERHQDDNDESVLLFGSNNTGLNDEERISQIIIRDVAAPTMPMPPNSEAYIASGMPPKRRRVAPRDDPVTEPTQWMEQLVNQAVHSVGVMPQSDGASAAGMMQPEANDSSGNTRMHMVDNFQDMVAEQVQTRLQQEANVYPASRFPNSARLFMAPTLPQQKPKYK